VKWKAIFGFLWRHRATIAQLATMVAERPTAKAFLVQLAQADVPARVDVAHLVEKPRHGAQPPPGAVVLR
jgi:hypothetical protein